MNQSEKVNLLGSVRRWMLTMASLAGLVLLFAAPSGAQSTLEKSTPNRAKVVAAPSEKPSPAKAAQSHANGKTEGIEVHGHWMIEVRNIDGTVVTHREFENSLAGQGSLLLASILGRQNTVGPWHLELISVSSPLWPCVTTSGLKVPCQIYEPGAGATSGDGIFTTLSVSVGAAGSLLLSGTAVAGLSGTIDTVTSINHLCSSGVATATCVLGPNIFASYSFTSATVVPAINVSFGQTVAVTVTFTFA